jgi:hypothetical protein
MHTYLPVCLSACLSVCSCYKFRAVVFCPWTNQLETVEATDPYSRCTTADGERRHG